MGSVLYLAGVKRLIMMLILAVLTAMVGACLWPRRWDDGLWDEFKATYVQHRSAVKQRRYAVLIDYRRPMWERRLWLIDIETEQAVLNAHVFHALRSGWFYADDLSNESGSLRSCAGAFLAQEAYQGQFGYAMRIDGLEPGRNDNARTRFIVCHSIHAWPYTNGCFGTFPAINQEMIDRMQGGGFFWVKGGG